MKIFMAILSLVLTMSMVFTGCGEETFTPTDVDSKITQTAGDATQENQEKTSPETTLSDEDAQKDGEDNGSLRETSAVKSEKQGNQTTVVENNSETDQSSGKNNGDTQASPSAYIPPSFTSVAGFKSWLQSGGIEEEKRADLLNSVKNSSTFSATAYCQPKIGDGNQMFQISKIDAYPYSVIYRYSFVKNSAVTGLKITTYVDANYMTGIANIMEDTYAEIDSPETRVFDKYGFATVNGITYYYYHYPANDSTTIYWQINDNTYYAVYYGDYDQINEILPMLELEQVSYKINTDAEVK